MTQAVPEWLALDVRDIDEKKLLPDVIGKDGVQPHLPTQMVKIPFENPDQVAVVSWRWDGDLQTKGSRNIASVIRVAKQCGIRYLFIDIISINQKLPPSDLIAQAAAFSTLYTKITVLAAYDGYGENWRRMESTVLRPWILNEIRLFRQNSGRIIYAGYARQGCSQVSTKSNSFVKREGLYKRPTSYENPQSEGSYFKFLLEIIWRTSFIECIIGVLLEDVGMSFVSDFKYIIHAYSHIISAAYEQMERNDYLLTIAILCRVHGQLKTPDEGLDAVRHIEKLRYRRYSFTARSDRSNGVWEYYQISLDGKPVAQWRRFKNGRFEMFDVAGSATERAICSALGFTESEYKNFVGTKEARRACLQMDTENIPPLALEVVEVDFSLDAPTTSS